MFSKTELVRAIEELEEAPATFQNAEKLSVFYQLYDHIYTRREPEKRIEPVGEVTINNYEGSEFLEAISGQEADAVWPIIDELMSAVKIMNPRLYDATLDSIRAL